MSARAHQDNFVASFPFGKVLLCSMMHFVGSFCSSWVLGEVTELTFSIMSTMKRVVVILSAVLYFGNPVTLQSILGMTFAVRGVHLCVERGARKRRLSTDVVVFCYRLAVWPATSCSRLPRRDRRCFRCLLRLKHPSKYVRRCVLLFACGRRYKLQSPAYGSK